VGLVCRKNGTQSGPGPAVNPQNESVLQPVLLSDENQIILGPKSDKNFDASYFGFLIFTTKPSAATVTRIH
jgi:hypothetical protein